MTKEIFREAFHRLRQRPIAILVVAIAYLPWLLQTLLSVPEGKVYAIAIVGTLISNTVVFFGLYFAVVIFLGVSADEGAPAGINASLDSIAEHRKSIVTLSLAFGAISFIAGQVALIIVQILASASLGNVQGTSFVVAIFVLQFLISVLPAFILTFIGLTPQLVHIGGVQKGGEALETSYRLVKGRYRRALPLYLVPTVIATVLVTGVSIGMVFIPPGWLLVPAFLVVGLIMGCMGAFIAACFNRFYLMVEEEEEAKRKAAKKAKSKAKAKPIPSKKKR